MPRCATGSMLRTLWQSDTVPTSFRPSGPVPASWPVCWGHSLRAVPGVTATAPRPNLRSWAAASAFPVTRPRGNAGPDRTTTWRCRRPPRRRCWATSAARDSRVRLPPGRSRATPWDSLPASGAVRTWGPNTASRTPSGRSPCSNTWSSSRGDANRCSRSRGTRARPIRAASAGSRCRLKKAPPRLQSRARPPLATGRPGPDPTGTGTRCAPNATRRA